MRTAQGTKLQDKLKLEKPNFSYTDFHHKIIKSSNQLSHQLAVDRQKQQIRAKEVDEDELVKYMSNLPSYLQKGVASKEKALNVGVLDWGVLEKWKYNQKQMPCRSNGYSPSSSNTSASFSTDESSTHSSRGHSCSPSHQRMRRHSLLSHLSSSVTECPSQVVESTGEKLRKFQELKGTQSGNLNRSGNLVNTALPFAKKHSSEEIEECKNGASVLSKQGNPGRGTLRNDLDTGVATFKVTKRETETQAVGDKATEENIQRPNSEDSSSNGSKKIVLLLPKSNPESRNAEGPHNSYVAAAETQKSKVCQRSFSDECKKECHSEVISDAHSCLLSSGSRKPVVEQLSSRGSVSVSINCSSALSKSVSQPLNAGSDPSKSKILEAKKEIKLPMISTSDEHSKASEEKPKKAVAEKVRSISPFYRLTSSSTKTNKSSSLNDNSDTHDKGSMHASRPSIGDPSSSDKVHRARSSPLRRLLDPILKPRTEHNHGSVKPSETMPVPTDKACKSVDGQHIPLATRSGKVKLGMAGCKQISVNELAMGKKHGASTVQALLRVTVKNGLPLYTFAVNNERNILAATVKTLSTEKNDSSGLIYTFFTIQDMKKKHGSWINQGGRGKGQDYVSNVVAQMKVSDCGFSNLSRQNIGVRDCVLFSVDLRQNENQVPEYQPNDELAAILIKYPKITGPSSMKEKPVESVSWPNSKESLSKNQDTISTTVIFPSAIHSLPSKGGPSSLIERWITGGSCDCGGWDLGCKLQVFTNLKRSSSSKAGYSTTDRFDLFPQGGWQENQQVFSLTPFKDGNYSVEFHSSISVLQAFAICTAVLDTRKQSELSESSHPVEERTLGEPVLVQNAGTSLSKSEGDCPRYVSYPPHSPAGRV